MLRKAPHGAGEEDHMEGDRNQLEALLPGSAFAEGMRSPARPYIQALTAPVNEALSSTAG